MKKRIWIFLCGMLVAFSSSYGQDRPRLWVSQDRLEFLREQIKDPQSYYGKAFLVLKNRVLTRNPDIHWESKNYNRSFFARDAALAYLLTQDTTYSNIAYDMLWDVYTKKDDNLARVPDRGYGLGRALTGMSFAIAYDFCFNGWPEEKREWVHTIISKSLDEWTELEYPKKSGNHVWEPYQSNWVPVCRGTEMIMMLSVYQENQEIVNVYRPESGTGTTPYDLLLLTRKERLEDLKTWLLTHIKNTYGNLGSTFEGFFYGTFAGSIMFPAALALRSAGDSTVYNELKKIEWWKLAMYQQGFSGDLFSLPSGPGNFKHYPMGWNSLLFAFTPKEHLGYYRYFFDHLLGTETEADSAFQYDSRRGGMIWNMFYYPDSIAPQNPDGIYPVLEADNRQGLYLFRNNWQYGKDISISFSADHMQTKNVHNTTEAFQIGLMAGNTNFIAGPDSKGGDSTRYSSLLVDGKAFVLNNKEPSDTGFTVLQEPMPNGGRVIIDGSQKYERLGVNQAQRHLLVDFEGEYSIISTMDDIQSLSQHDYQWQLHIPDAIDGGPESVSTSLEGNYTSATMAKGEDYLKLWILHPQNMTIESTRPFVAKIQGTNEKIWVLMTAGQGQPPLLESSGLDLDAELQLGNRILSWSNQTGLSVESGVTAMISSPSSGRNSKTWNNTSGALLFSRGRNGERFDVSGRQNIPSLPVRFR